MNDFLLDLGISAILSALRSAFSNPYKRNQLKKVMLKIYKQIGLVYSGDSEFIDSAVSAHKIEK